MVNQLDWCGKDHYYPVSYLRCDWICKDTHSSIVYLDLHNQSQICYLVTALVLYIIVHPGRC